MRKQNNLRQITLDEARDKFDQYGREHRQKASRAQAARLGCSDAVECARLEREEASSNTKAETNEDMVKRITAVLESPSDNVLEETVSFAEIVNPEGLTGTSQQAQMGVHFEEVSEMLTAFVSSDPAIQKAIEAAWAANKELGELLKQSAKKPSLKIIDRIEFIDAIADQLVTATLCAVQFRMDPVGALREVNRSNFSKLTDGVMALDPVTAKWIKGPNYTKAELRRFA